LQYFAPENDPEFRVEESTMRYLLDIAPENNVRISFNKLAKSFVAEIQHLASASNFGFDFGFFDLCYKFVTRYGNSFISERCL
jgi:hypothetical protein